MNNFSVEKTLVIYWNPNPKYISPFVLLLVSAWIKKQEKLKIWMNVRIHHHKYITEIRNESEEQGEGTSVAFL